MAILPNQEKVLLAELITASGRFSQIEEREALIIESGRQPANFNYTAGSARAAALNFVNKLNEGEDLDALSAIVDAIDPALPGRQRDLMRIQNVLDEWRKSARIPITLKALMQTRPEVRDILENSRGNFEAVRHKIAIAGYYKELHELLHRLQLECYIPFIRIDKSDIKNNEVQNMMRQYFDKLKTIIAHLRKVANRKLFAIDETAWLYELDQVQDALQRAIVDSDSDQFQMAIQLLHRVLSRHPARINSNLMRETPTQLLRTLIETMARLLDRFEQYNLEPQEVGQFKEDIEALKRLNEGMDALIKEHATWQDIDVMLHIITGNLSNIIDELDLYWPQLTKKSEPLYSDGNTDRTQAFRCTRKKLEHSMKEGNYQDVVTNFWQYRIEAGHRFFMIDNRLKEKCSHARHVGESLNNILR